MEQQTTSPVSTAPAALEGAATADACPACPPAAPPRKLDLTGMAAPGDLKAMRLEEFTIDGICGVY